MFYILQFNVLQIDSKCKVVNCSCFFVFKNIFYLFVYAPQHISKTFFNYFNTKTRNKYKYKLEKFTKFYSKNKKSK